MRIRIFIIAIFTSLISIKLLTAQVNLSLSLPNPMPGQLSVWESDRTLIQAVIDNPTGTTYQQVRFSFVIMNVTTGIEAARSNDNSVNIPKFSIPPGLTTLYGTDLVNADAVTIDEALRTIATTTNSLPEGEYEICAHLLADDGSLLTTPDVCRIFSVFFPDPPTLIIPDDNAVLESNTLPTFTWTPVILSPGAQARYRLVIAPVYEGQSPRDAIDRNDPLLNQIVLMNSYAYQTSDPLFSIIESATSFAWQIQALDNLDQPATRNEGKSEIYTFSFSPLQHGLTIEVSPQQIDISPANQSHEITFTFSLAQSAEEQIVLTSYKAAWTDENRFYREVSDEIVLDPPIVIFPGAVQQWSKTDSYDEQLQEILLANREQADYLKTFTFFSSGNRAIPGRSFEAPSYHVYLSGSTFSVTANPPVLEFNPAVTSHEINFEFQGSSTANAHVTQMSWTARFADGSTAEQGTVEMNLNVPRAGISNWSFQQNASREMQCGILNHLRVDETDVTLIYQFDGELQREGEPSSPVTAMAGVIMHISGGSFTVSANPAILQFNPEQTQQEISFQFEAGCNTVRVTHYAATGTTADNRSVDIEPNVIDLTIPAGRTATWSTPQFLDAEGQLLLLNRLGVDETDIQVIYQFDGELQLDGGHTQPISAMASFIMRVSRTGIAPVGILISSSDAFPLQFNPEISYHPVSFSFRLYEETGAVVTRNIATWYFPDGTTEVIEDDMVDITVLRGESGTWDTGLRIEGNIQQNRLDHFGVNRLPVHIKYVFEIHDDRGNIYDVRALTAGGDDLDFIIYRNTQDTVVEDLIVWAIPSEVSFFPGSTSHEITYNLDLYPSAPASDTLKSVAVTYRNEDGTLYRGPVVNALANPIVLNIGDQTTTTAALTVDDTERESILSGGRNTGTLTAIAEFSGVNSIGQMIFAESNPITMRIFRTSEAAGLSDYVLMNGVAYIRTTNQTTVTTEGERKILNGSATLVILPTPFDSTEVAVDLVNLTFAPGSGLHVTSGSLMAESPPDSRLFGLLGNIFNITQLSYDHSRDSTQRFLINHAYVNFLNDRIDLTDVIVNRDGVSFEHASIEKSLFNFLTLRLTDMHSGKEHNKKVLSFTVHARLKGKPRNDEFGFTSLKFIDGGGLELHITPEPAPLRIIPGTDYLRFKDFEVQRDSDNWFIKVTADLTYPPPFNSLGPVETFFKVDQDGNIVGEIAPIKEMTPGFAGDRTLVTFGRFAVIDLTYLGLQLSLVDGEIDNEHSRVGLACDFYFELVGHDSLRVSVGSPNDPGITIDFDGNVNWQAITIAHDKKLKFGPLYLKLSNFVVNPDPDTSKNYYFELSGGLGVDFPKVDGEINFEAIRITREGNFDMANTIVRGGEFSIVDVVHLGLDSMSFSNDPATITFEDKTGDHKEERSVDADSYLRLKGASLSVGSAGDGGAGGFEELLVYTSGDQTSFVLRKAKITIASLEVKIDCKYLTDDPQLGTILSVAGSVKTPKFEGAVIGKMGQRADGKDTYGLFLAVSDLGLQLGPITLDALGGGFFYNPTEEDLEIVRSNCGIDRPEIRESISAHRPEGANDPGSFAAMIYAGAFVGSKDAVEGRALITITENSLSLDMQVEVLKKAGSGAAYLVFGWDPTYAEGRITFDLDYHSILKADVEVDFYAYTEEIWGLNGTTEVKLLVFAEADADFFVGPPGFLLDTKLDIGFDVGVLKADAGFETKVWWQRNVSWGAYVKVWAEGELLWGLVGVAGSLEGALIGDPELIYAVGSFRAEVCWVEVFNGSIWITVGVDGFDGGTGRNSRYDGLIEDANNMADKMEEEMNKLAAAIDETQNAIQSMSDEQVVRAGQELMTNMTQHPLTAALYYLSYKTDHDDYEGTNTQSTVIRDILFGRTPRNNRWWLDTLINGKNDLAVKEEEIQSTVDALTAKKDRMQQKLNAYQNLLTGQLPTIQDLQCMNPIGEETYATVVLNGIERRVKNGFTFDTLQANQNKENTERTKESTDAYEDRLFEMVKTFRSSLDTIDNLLYNGTESIRNIGRDYANTFEDINDYYENMFKYFVTIQNLAATHRAALWEPDIRNAITRQTNNVAPNEQSLRRLQNLVTLRSGVIQSLDETYNPQLNAETLDSWKALCDTLGILMWYRIPYASFTYLIESSNASRDTVREVFDRTRNGFITSWADYTQTLEGIYTRTSRLYELIYDLYDNLALTATRIPITKTVARLLGNPTPRQYYTTARNGIAEYLEVPRITSFTGTSLSATDHTAKISLNFNAAHPRGIAEYAYHVKYPSSPLQPGQQPMILMVIGSPKYRSVGSDNQTHLLLVQNYGIGEPDRPGDYEISLRARTRSGYTITRKGTVNVEYSTGSIVTNSISTTDNTPPTTPVVTDGGQYTSATGVLFANWQAADNQSGIQEYQYSVETQTITRFGGNMIGGVLVGGREIILPLRIREWTSVGGMTELNIRDLSLEHGKTYWIKVRAKNGVDLWSDEGKSDGIVVDTSKPVAPEITEFSNRALVQNALRLHFTPANDLESDIQHYEVNLGTHPYGTDIVDLITLPGDAIFRTLTNISLVNGNSYFLTLKAFNGAGLMSIDTASVTIHFTDETAPDPPTITEAYYRAKDSTLVVRWSASDRQSGISDFQYALSEMKRGVLTYTPWVSVGMERSLELKRGIMPANIRIKAINGVRLFSQTTEPIERR